MSTRLPIAWPVIFLLTPGRMRDAIAMGHEVARQRDGLDTTATEADLREACRRQSSRRVMSIARPVEAPAGMTLDYIVCSGRRRSSSRRFATGSPS